VAVGGGNDAHIDPRRRRGAEPFEFPLLEHAQELDLQVEGQLADLVQEDRAAMGELEATDFAGEGAGEGPLLVTEELTLDQCGRDGRAVDLDQRPLLPCTAVVNGPCDQFFARPRFAQDEDRGLGRRHLLHLMQDLQEGLAATNDLLEGVIALNLLPKIDVLCLQLLLQLRDVAQGVLERCSARVRSSISCAITAYSRAFSSAIAICAASTCNSASRWGVKAWVVRLFSRYRRPTRVAWLITGRQTMDLGLCCRM